MNAAAKPFTFTLEAEKSIHAFITSHHIKSGLTLKSLNTLWYTKCTQKLCCWIIQRNIQWNPPIFLLFSSSCTSYRLHPTSSLKFLSHIKYFMGFRQSLSLNTTLLDLGPSVLQLLSFGMRSLIVSKTVQTSAYLNQNQDTHLLTVYFPTRN